MSTPHNRESRSETFSLGLNITGWNKGASGTQCAEFPAEQQTAT